MHQPINLHTLGYLILANFSEQDIIEGDITLNENSVCLLIFQNGAKMHVNSYNNINVHTTLFIVKLINFMRILSGAANSVIIHKTICLIPETY